MMMTRNATVKDNLCIEGLTFEQVEDFKYLGVNISEKNNMGNEIRIRLNVANRYYFTMKDMFSSKLLSRRTKERLYCTYLRPIERTHARRGLATKDTKKDYRVSSGKYSGKYMDWYIIMT